MGRMELSEGGLVTKQTHKLKSFATSIFLLVEVHTLNYLNGLHKGMPV